MKKWMLIWLMVIGVTTSSFSQTSYPRKILFQNDTLVALTKPQLIRINRSLNDYSHLKEAYKLSQRSLLVSDSIINYYKLSVESQKGVIDLQEQQFNVQKKFYEDALRKEKKKRRKLAIGVGVGGVLLGGALGVLLSR